MTGRGSTLTPRITFVRLLSKDSGKCMIPEGYSLWFCDYKYNDENTVSFVTLNKVGGFLQRMDLARKYAFGKMLIIGSEPPFKVKGLWLFRGQEIPQFIIDECYDMELYEWTKVDISDEAQKERVSQMIEDHEPFEGDALLDANESLFSGILSFLPLMTRVLVLTSRAQYLWSMRLHLPESPENDRAKGV
ncbi:hypothetical protein OIU77_028005 [Salix suchowensis]|uniref:EF-1-gamma C-terminal domain-containing protein n=1 Tax=Salix suchowensis TaxID=1278906 RepID=A0ABQ9BVL0_9ROSI|nr:hypothetical protein OIU77_028005 [Salix suchowensis]